MSERVSGKAFLESEGLSEWRPIWGGGWACAHFGAGSFGAGVEFVSAIGELAAAAGHDADVDLRPEGVTVRLFSGEHDGLSTRDVELARAISVAANERGLAVDPSAVQHVQVAIGAVDIPAVAPFWRAVLGYTAVGGADLVDSHRRGPSFWFQQLDAARPGRGRFHIDLYVPPDEAEARIAAALAAGGRMANDAFAPEWWTLADPEGNEADIAIWMEP